MTLLEELHRQHYAPARVVMTGFGSIDTAIRAMKLGAFEFVQKPFKVEEMIQTAANALAAVATSQPSR
jgi:DNA-binding NtrC family response regulator